MFLTVLSAIALTVGSAMTLHDLNSEKALIAQDQQEPIVEVAPVQPADGQSSDIGW